MSYFLAVFMGIVQGITEFLPISSSGHLAILRNLFNINVDNIIFEVLLHFGTLVAIIIAFYKDVGKLIVEAFGILIDLIRKIIALLTRKGNPVKVIHSSYRRFVMLIIVASIPTAFIGLIGKDLVVKAYNTILIPGILLLLTGYLLQVTHKLKPGKKNMSTASYKNAFIIGTFQGFSILPGLSRSGSTIAGGLLNGLSKEFAVKFSFLMSLPAVLGATILELKDIPSGQLSTIVSGPYIVGTIVSAVVGYICIKSLIAIIKRNKLHYFTYYCYIVGILAIVAYFMI